MRVAQLPSFSVSCSKLSGLRRAPGSREETTPFCLRLQNQTFVPFRDKKVISFASGLFFSWYFACDG